MNHRAYVLLILLSSYGMAQTPSDSVSLFQLQKSWKQRMMIPIQNETILTDAPMAPVDSSVRVTVNLRFVNSPQVTFQFPVLNKDTYEYKDTAMTISLPDTGLYSAWSIPLQTGERSVTVICVPIGYPNYTSTGYSVTDSLMNVLALLRWGIETISFTDSNFWKFHEEELRILRGGQSAAAALSYFAGQYTDTQVDSIRQSGAVIYYMGTKSTTTGKTPIRGYGR